jgi:hypothetical protein
MAAITKKETRLKLQFVANTDHSIHAGIVAVHDWPPPWADRTADLTFPGCGSKARQHGGALSGGGPQVVKQAVPDEVQGLEIRTFCSRASGGSVNPRSKPSQRQHESYRKDWGAAFFADE